MNIKKTIILSLVAVVLLCRGAFALEPHLSQRGNPGEGSFDQVLDSEFSLYYLPEEEGAPLMSYIRQNEPPLLRSYALEPETPGPDDEITVTAEINNDMLMTRSRTLDATLYYSYDGKQTWHQVNMDEVEENNLWSATIPPAGEPTTLYFYFMAMDDAENYYMEVPQTMLGWASANADNHMNSISDDNDVYSLVPDDLDLLSVSLGYDGQYIYTGIVVEGEIAAGTVTPFEVNVYSAGFYIPTGKREIGPKPRYVLEHAQHAQFITFPIVGLLDVEKRLAEIRAADARYYSRRNRLNMRIDKSVLAQHNPEYVRIAFGTALGLGALPLVVDPRDVSSFINVVFGEHWIVIE